jgi:hypothetical protein
MYDISIENGACRMLDHQDLRRSRLGRAMILVRILFGLIGAGLPLDLQSFAVLGRTHDSAPSTTRHTWVQILAIVWIL